MLTNTVFTASFGDLRAQQLSAILFSNAFQCYITQSLTFFDCLFIHNPEKMASKYPALLIDINYQFGLALLGLLRLYL